MKCWFVLQVMTYQLKQRGFLTLFICFLVFPLMVNGQQDCFDAINVCTNSFTQNTSYAGVGAQLEVAPATTCLGNGETNSAWYTFSVSTGGTLEFQLNPISLNDDYDFALYDLTNDSCSGIAAGLSTPISCNYSADAGPTGLSAGGTGNNNGSSDPNQNAALTVAPGERYALMVSNFTASQTGYTLTFSGTASIADNQPALPDSIALQGRCNPQQVLLFFDEAFLCNSVSGNSSEITVTGPEPVTVNTVNALACAGGRSDRIRIRFTNKIMTIGTYTITIGSGTDGNSYLDNCGNEVPIGTTFSFDVEYIGPDLTITNIVDANCGQDNGSAEAIATLGTEPYTYGWNSNPVQNTSNATGLSPRTYIARVTDANGCSEFRGFTVNNNSPIDLSNHSATGVSCNGATDGTAQVTPAGGAAPYSFSWQTNPVQTGANASNLPGGEVEVIITDNTGCEERLEIDIPEPPAISAPIIATNPDCGQTNGQATVNASGGNGGFIYQWSTNPPQATATASGLPAGVYSVLVSDQNGCSTSANVILTDNFAPNATISGRVPDCGQGIGQATAQATSGTAPYTYQWNTTPPQSTATAIGLAGGDYFVTITDANGCVQIINVKIDSIPPPQVSISEVQPTCGQSDGELTASVNSGTAPYTFDWQPSGNTLATETGLPEGVYTVTVTDSIGCADSTTVVLEQLPPVSSAIVSSACLGEPSTFSFTTTSGATDWEWNFGDGNTSTDSIAQHVYSATGDYQVTLYLNGGCEEDTVYATVSSFQPPQPAFQLNPEQPTTRTGAEFIYTGSGGTNFNWIFGDGNMGSGSNPYNLYEEEGVYQVELTVIDENGCSDSITQRIEVLLHPVIYFPNAIIPSGTTENQRFRGYGVGVTNAELHIFNRWGNLVFASKDVNEILNSGWDATYNGSAVPQGAYPYKIRADFYNGSSFEKLGTVTVIR